MVNDSFFTLACAGLIGILFGLALCFAGYRLFLVLLPIWGFFFGLALGAQTMQALLRRGLPCHRHQLGRGLHRRRRLCGAVVPVLHAGSRPHRRLAGLFDRRRHAAGHRHADELHRLAHRHRRGRRAGHRDVPVQPGEVGHHHRHRRPGRGRDHRLHRADVHPRARTSWRTR